MPASDATDAQRAAAAPKLAPLSPMPAADAAPLWAFLDEALGLGEATLAGVVLCARPSGGAIWAVQADAAALLGALEGRPEAAGIVVFRRPPPAGTPTTIFLQRFGRLATRGAIDLPDDALEALLAGEAVPYAGPLEGPVLLRTPLAVVGRGRAGEGAVRAELPKRFGDLGAGAAVTGVAGGAGRKVSAPDPLQ